MTYFHGSARANKLGTVIEARRRFTEFSGRRLCGGPSIEDVFESFRPPGIHPRGRGIFMVRDPRLLNLAGADTKFVYSVIPEKPQRHHWGWFSKVLGVTQGRTLERCLKFAERCAFHYWRGDPPPLDKGGGLDRRWAGTWEWISPRVKVIGKWRYLRHVDEWVQYK